MKKKLFSKIVFALIVAFSFTTTVKAQAGGVICTPCSGCPIFHFTNSTGCANLGWWLHYPGNNCGDVLIWAINPLGNNGPIPAPCMSCDGGPCQCPSGIYVADKLGGPVNYNLAFASWTGGTQTYTGIPNTICGGTFNVRITEGPIGTFTLDLY